MHPAYYDGASACILVFDVTRKPTYQHLQTWFDELRESAGKIPCICVANKIDMNYKAWKPPLSLPLLLPRRRGPCCLRAVRALSAAAPCRTRAILDTVVVQVTSKTFKFPEEHGLPFFFVSAADGTNVVTVFQQAIEEAVRHQARVKDAVARGEYEDGAAGDLQFMAEVRDTLKYFDDKEAT